MSLAVYVYSDANRNQVTIDADDYNFAGTWSSLGTYVAATLDVVTYGNGRYIAIIDNVGGNPAYVPPRNIPKKWSPLVKIREGDEPPFPAPQPGTFTSDEFYILGTNALYAAWAGTAAARDAYNLAAIGTNVGTNAIQVAGGALVNANAALILAWAGTNAIPLANQALETSWAGTNAVALANQALQLAWIGTNASGDQTLAYNALETAWAGTSGANSALGIATTGTAGVSAAIDLANQALMTAWLGTVASGGAAYNLAAIGTNVGTNALDRGAAAIDLANDALMTAWLGTVASGGAAYDLAAIGTNVGTNALDRGASAINLANQALMTAWVGTSSSGGAAYDLAAIGTNVGTNALNRGAAAIDLANQALVTAWVGTSAGPGPAGVSTLAWNGSVAVDMAGSAYQRVRLGGDAYITAVGYAPGLAVTVELSGTGAVGLTYNPDWKYLSPFPTAISANAVGVVGLVCFGTDAASTTAAYAATDYVTTATQVSVGTRPASQASAGTLYYDFAGSAYQITTVDRALWISTVNMGAGREIGIILAGDGSPHALGFSSFKWFGTTPPGTITNKEIMVAATAFDTTISTVRAAVCVQV